MKTVNVQCKTGFALALASIFLAFTLIVPFLAVVFGILGLARFDPEKHRHQWMGWAASVIGFVYIFVGLYTLGVIG